MDKNDFEKINSISLVLDNNKAKEILGWTPTVALGEGLSKIYETFGI